MSCLLRLVALPTLIEIFLQSCQLGGLIVFKGDKKVLHVEILPQHTIADLNFGITFVLFSQEKPFR